MKFTDLKIKNLKPKAERYEVWESNGLGIRITPKGTKSWVFLYRFGGKARRMTLGAYPAMSVAQAHEAHGRALAALERGTDPGAVAVEAHQEARKALTVATLIDEYMERWAKPRKRSWREDQRILQLDVLPAWQGRKARDITRRDVITLLDGIAERGAPIAANRTLEIIRKMFNFAIEQDIVLVNPCAKVRAPGIEKRRDRVLTEDEIRAFWSGLDAARMDETTKLALKLQLLTAQRCGEVAGMAWQEVDLKTGWWVIPGEKAKNGLAHRVPLSPLAIELLEQAKVLAADSPWVFPGPRGDKPMVETSLGHATRRNLAVFGIAHFTPHDLRRTAASHMTGMGIFRLVVSKLLNHVDKGVTAIYDRHSYDVEKRTALDAWATRLNEILTGAEAGGNVIAMRRTG